MKKLIFILFVCLLCKSMQAQVANAGKDVTVYLTKSNTAVIGSSTSNGDSYQWTKITDVYPEGATPPTDPAVIVSPTSKVSSLTGLIQGVWYYQLAVTTGGVTKKDTVIVRVDYDVPPRNAVLINDIPISDPVFAADANDRTDTTNDIGYTGVNKYINPLTGKPIYFERARSNEAMIDSSRGKLYNTLEDGYHRSGEAFDRTQVSPIGNYFLDSNKTTVMDLKFYLPQRVRSYLDTTANWYNLAIFGIHASDGATGTGEVFMFADSLAWNDNHVPTVKKLLSTDPAEVGQAHTVRITVREGKNGGANQKPFVKVEVDGNLKFYRDTGDIGRTWQLDYLKMTGLYDYGNHLVNVNNFTRHRKFSIVTEAMNVYNLNPNPTVFAGDDQTTSSNSVTLSGSANDEGVSGHGVITSYQWTKISGGSATIVSPNSATTNLTGLSGIYQFQLKATDNSGISGYDTVTVSSVHTYYVSQTGYDNNPGTDPSAPWQSIDKVNSFPFAPGDSILFKSGDTFQGKLIVQTPSVIYGSYGTGAMPVITGFNNITSWINKGGNIWESTDAVSTLPALNVVVIGGKSRDMGHTPNIQSDGFRPNYYTFQSHLGNTSITSTSLDGVINWKGADVVIRNGSYIWNKATISNQSGGILTFPATSNTPSDGYGFWIQNDIRTLDQQNEWYYNDTTKKLDIYSTTMPTGVQVPIIDTLLYDFAQNNVTINGIDFEGANNTALAFHGTQGITVENCNLHFVGQYAIDYNHSSGTPTIINNDFADIVQFGFFNQDATGAANISHNSFERINLVTPIWPYDEASGAINCVLPSSIIQWNRVDSVGRKGILFKGANVDVSHNYVTNFALTRQDAGGIYTGYTGEPGKQVYDNIVMYGWGNEDGMPAGSGLAANGIYLDDWNSNVNCYGNTVAHVASAGIFLHNADSDYIHNNTIYDHSTGDDFTKGGIMIQTDANMQTHPTRSNRIASNTIIATTANRYAIFSYNSVSTADSKLFGTTDSNYYMNPIANDVNMFDFFDKDAGVARYYDLAGFRTFLGQDAHSAGSPKFITSNSDLKFIYNPTDHDSTVSLGANYIDAKNTYHNGNITLQPFASSVLLLAPTVAAPTISMSGAQNNITATFTSIYAVPAWASGHNGTVLWTKISGPGTTVFSNNTSTSTSVSNLQTGTYVFQCEATQDDGQIIIGTVQVTVLLPVVVGQSIQISIPGPIIIYINK